MSVVLVISTVIRLAALGWSVVLLWRIRDWRLGFLTVVLGLMGLRQILTLLAEGGSHAPSITYDLSELPGLAVSILALLAVFLLGRILAERKQPDEVSEPDQLPSPPWRIHLVIGGVGLILLGMLGFGLHTGTKMYAQYSPLIDASMEIKLQATMAHLRFAETMGGDRKEDIEGVWRHLELADWYANAMLEGGKNPRGAFRPLDDAEMRSKISGIREQLGGLQAISRKASIARNAAGVDAEIDEQFDAVFDDLINQTDEVQSSLQRLLARDLRNFQYLQALLIVSGIILMLIIGLILGIHERRRAESFLALERMNVSLQTEIVERQRAEQVLRESEEFFSGTLNDMLTLVAILEPNGEVVFVNNTPLNLAGITLDEVKGRMFYDTYWWQYSEEARQQIREDIESCASGETLVHDIEVQTAGGKQIWIQYSMHPIYNERGEVKYLVPEGRDITERKQAEAVLKRSEARLRDAQRIAHFGHWDWDILANDLYWSDEIYRVFGLEPQEFGATYEAFLDTLHPEDRDFVRQSVSEALSEAMPYSIDHRIILPSGEVRVVHEEAEVAFGPGGEPIRMMGTVQDITQRRRAEAHIQHLQSVLKAIRGVNQLIVHERDQREMLKTACSILDQTRSYRFVWIGLVDEETKRILPVAQAGLEDGYLATTCVSSADSENREGSNGTAARWSKPHVIRDIAGEPGCESWKIEAMRRGYVSSAAVPLVHEEKLYGALNVYADTPDSFDEEEIDLLSELGQDIAFALHNIELEREHERVEKDLQEHREENIKLSVTAQEQSELQRWLNTLDTFVGKLDSNGVMISCNEAPLKAGGLTSGEVLGKYFPDTRFWSHSTTERARIVRAIKRAKAGLQSRIEASFRNADGDPVPIIFNCQPVMDEDGRVEYITAEGKTIVDELKLRNELEKAKDVLEIRVRERTSELLEANRRMRDEITERKRAEEALRENEEKFRHLSEGISEGIAVIIDGKNHWVNKAFCDTFMYRQEELIGRGMDYLVVPEELPLLDQRMKARLAGEAVPLRHETIAGRKDGTRINIEVSAKVISFEGREAIQLVIRDITERKEAERALQKARDELEAKVVERTRELIEANVRLEEIDRLKSEFLATMSHELRTPLNSIIGFTGIILKGIAGEINEEQEKQLTMVNGSARHLLGLINDILDLSRIEAGKMELSMKEMELSNVIAEVAQIISPSIAQKGLGLVIDIPEKMPVICSDAKKVFQILLNLVNNAVKFTDQGEIRIECEVDDRGVVVSVSDTGAGIKNENLDCLFEAFRQVDGTAQRRYQGAGLGLFLCKRFVSLIGGDIWVESEYGKGSRFTFLLPLGLEECEQDEEDDTDRRG